MAQAVAKRFNAEIRCRVFWPSGHIAILPGLDQINQYQLNDSHNQKASRWLPRLLGGCWLRGSLIITPLFSVQSPFWCTPFCASEFTNARDGVVEIGPWNYLPAARNHVRPSCSMVCIGWRVVVLSPFERFLIYPSSSLIIIQPRFNRADQVYLFVDWCF